MKTTDEGLKDGFSIVGDTGGYVSDRYDPEFSSPEDQFTNGWMAYHEGAARDPHASEQWLAGYDDGHFSGREPCVKTQEKERERIAMETLKALQEQVGGDEFLADVRERLTPFSQSQLASEMGVPPQHVSRWMTGRINPSLETRLAMRDAITAMETRRVRAVLNRGAA